MKSTVLVFLMFIALSFGAFAQKGEAIFPHPPSKEEMYQLAMSATDKGYQYREFIISAVKAHISEIDGYPVDGKSVDQIFAHIYNEDVVLLAGDYENSFWYPAQYKMKTFKGISFYKDKAWVFRYKGLSFVLIKGDCGNTVFCRLMSNFTNENTNTNNNNNNNNNGNGYNNNQNNNYNQNSNCNCPTTVVVPVVRYQRPVVYANYSRPYRQEYHQPHYNHGGGHVTPPSHGGPVSGGSHGGGPVSGGSHGGSPTSGGSHNGPVSGGSHGPSSGGSHR